MSTPRPKTPTTDVIHPWQRALAAGDYFASAPFPDFSELEHSVRFLFAVLGPAERSADHVRVRMCDETTEVIVEVHRSVATAKFATKRDFETALRFLRARSSP